MADDFEIVVDLSGLEAFFDEVSADVDKALDLAATRTSAQAVINHAQYPPTYLIDTGAMINAWFSRKKAPFDYIAGNATEYAIYHEFGTRHLPARPILGPAFEQEKRVLQAAIKALGRQWSRKYGDGA